MSTGLLTAIIFFLTGGFLVFLAITITRDNFSNRANRAAGVMLFFAGLGPLAMALGEFVLSEGTGIGTALIRTPGYNLFYLWEFFFPALLVFSWVFPVDRMQHFKMPRLRYAILLPQIAHILLAVFYEPLVQMLNAIVEGSAKETLTGTLLMPFGWISSQLILLFSYLWDHHEIVFGTVNLAYVAVAIYFLETSSRLLTNPRLQRQARTVLWAARIGLPLTVLGLLAWMVSNGPRADIFGHWALAAGVVVGTVFITYAIIRHQFLSVQLVFRQSLIYSVSSVILVGAYIMLGMKSESFLVPIFGKRAEAISYVFILLILLMFQPISSWIENIINAMFVRTRTDHRAILERFSREVISLFDPQKLRQTIDEALKTSLLVNQVYFVLFDDSVEEYALLKSEDQNKRIVIERNDMLLRGINLLDTPTRLGSLSDFFDGSKLAEILQSRGVRLVLPLKDAQHMLGFLALTTKAAGYRYSAEDFNLLGVLSNQMVSALTNARLYADSLERMRLQEEVNMARQIQLNLLPSAPPLLTCSQIAASSTPSRTVGGDFYDFLIDESRNRTGFVIADASGKGMPAALLIAQIQAILRSEINNGNEIPKTMRNMNTQVALSTSSDTYVTLFYGELDHETGVLEYSNAGHNYPVLVRSDGGVEHLQTGGPVIGAFPNMEYTSARVKLNPHDVLFLFTDGLSEAMDSDGAEYSEQRIMEFVVKHRENEPDILMAEILKDVQVYDPTIPPRDDTTVIALKMTNGLQ